MTCTEFDGRHLDLQKIWEDNSKKDAFRKNGCIVNTGAYPSKEKLRKKREENQAK